MLTEAAWGAPMPKVLNGSAVDVPMPMLNVLIDSALDVPMPRVVIESALGVPTPRAHRVCRGHADAEAQGRSPPWTCPCQRC